MLLLAFIFVFDFPRAVFGRDTFGEYRATLCPLAVFGRTGIRTLSGILFSFCTDKSWLKYAVFGLCNCLDFGLELDVDEGTNTFLRQAAAADCGRVLDLLFATDL